MNAHSSLPRDHGIVYFIRNDTTGHIKIGYTERLRDRIWSLKTKVGHAVTLLAWTSGPRREWRELERRFLALVGPTRITGEWFLPSDLMHRCMQACSTDNPSAFIDQAAIELHPVFGVRLPRQEVVRTPGEVYWGEWLEAAS